MSHIDTPSLDELASVISPQAKGSQQAKYEFAGKRVVLENQLFGIRIPNKLADCGPNDYALLSQCCADIHELWSWGGIYSWVQSEASHFGRCASWMARQSMRDQLHEKKQYKDHDYRGEDVGFRPILTPLSNHEAGTCRDVSMLAGAVNGSKTRMYALIMDGAPVRQDTNQPAFYVPGAELSFTDEFLGHEYLIPWVFYEGMAVASKNILCGISWIDLEQQGFCL